MPTLIATTTCTTITPTTPTPLSVINTSTNTTTRRALTPIRTGPTSITGTADYSKDSAIAGTAARRRFSKPIDEQTYVAVEEVLAVDATQGAIGFDTPGARYSPSR